MNTNQIEIRFVREYTPQNQKVLPGQRPKKNYIYELVNATKEQIESYKTFKGEHYRESDDKKPLYFTQRWMDATIFPGRKIFLIETEKKSWVPDTSALDRLANLADQYGVDLALRLQGHNVAAAPVITEKEEDEDPEPVQTSKHSAKRK